MWRGPGRIIGFYSHNKIWVSHGNKVLQPAPEQLRKMTEQEMVATTCVTPDLLADVQQEQEHMPSPTSRMRLHQMRKNDNLQLKRWEVWMMYRIWM